MQSPYINANGTSGPDPLLPRNRKRRLCDDGDGVVRSSGNHHHKRVVLLFDMDCFYAQCERVRLGLPLDVKLCLFQWNSVLAVTYPARKYGIKRGDSWDDVSTKSKHADHNNASTISGTRADHGCYTIHLPVIGHDTQASTTNDDKSLPDDSSSIEASFKRMFELSREEQLRCQQAENGVRRFHHEGKACLERYRLASMRIFAVVLESLQERITHQRGYSFVLERASIDEFYLDLTDYCYQRNQDSRSYCDPELRDENKNATTMDQTVVAGQKSRDKNLNSGNVGSTENPMERALNRACQVSHWIRQDIWRILGFTMSAGISTNKTMAKLAASYGKPNGQAVLYPRHFSGVLSETKITKVRNFGGKLGKTALKLLLEYKEKEGQPWCNTNNGNELGSDRLEYFKANATMTDLCQVPLPFLLQSALLSKESAHFIFSASQGIDHETVKKTSGALVKSITAFKSFAATKSHAEIFDRWLTILAKEIIERVTLDTARNKRYPKSCTLNYTYYTTPTGHRPSTSSTRSQRQSRSLRLRFPLEREGTHQEKTDSLLCQSRTKLIPIVKDHPLRGVGLSVSNFIESSSSQHSCATGPIQSFFSTKTGSVPPFTSLPSVSPSTELGRTCGKRVEGKTLARTKSAAGETTMTIKRSHLECIERVSIPDASFSSGSNQSKHADLLRSDEMATLKFPRIRPATNHGECETLESTNVTPAKTTEDKDFEYAKKLQATFDRENYALATATRRQKNATSSKKTQRIESFFRKR